MIPQPEALRLADWLEADACDLQTPRDAAAELRRLHELNEDKTEIIAALSANNQELLEALNWIDSRCPAMLMDHPLHAIHREMSHDAGACARAAIAKLKEKNA